MFRCIAVLALAARALADGFATYEQISLVDAQFNNSGLTFDVPKGFGVGLRSKVILNVEYEGKPYDNGELLTVDRVEKYPTSITVTPIEDAFEDFNSKDNRYVLALSDASALGDPDPKGNYRHFLADKLQGVPQSKSDPTFKLSGGWNITSYSSPSPDKGTGTHRYAWLLFTQTAGFLAPQDLTYPPVKPGYWSVSGYVDYGLQLVGASFFTLRNGDPTGSVSSTQAVNTQTMSLETPTSAQPQPTLNNAGEKSAKKANSASPASALKVPVYAAGTLAVLCAALAM